MGKRKLLSITIIINAKLPLVLPKMKIVKAPGFHKTVPRLQQIFVDVGNQDKITLIVDTVLAELEKASLSIPTNKGQKPTLPLLMIFCNTAKSCRAVEYALNEAQIPVASYHGELNSKQRSYNLQQFRNAAESESLSVSSSSIPPPKSNKLNAAASSKQVDDAFDEYVMMMMSTIVMKIAIQIIPTMRMITMRIIT